MDRGILKVFWVSLVSRAFYSIFLAFYITGILKVCIENIIYLWPVEIIITPSSFSSYRWSLVIIVTPHTTNGQESAQHPRNCPKHVQNFRIPGPRKPRRALSSDHRGCFLCSSVGGWSSTPPISRFDVVWGPDARKDWEESRPSLEQPVALHFNVVQRHKGQTTGAWISFALYHWIESYNKKFSTYNVIFSSDVSLLIDDHHLGRMLNKFVKNFKLHSIQMVIYSAVHTNAALR